MTDTRTVTGHTIVMVRIGDGEVAVRRGEELPEGVTAAEVARLEKAGTFADPPVASLVAQGARPAKAPVAEAQAALAAVPETFDGPRLDDGEDDAPPAPGAPVKRAGAITPPPPPPVPKG